VGLSDIFASIFVLSFIRVLVAGSFWDNQILGLFVTNAKVPDVALMTISYFRRSATKV